MRRRLLKRHVSGSMVREPTLAEALVFVHGYNVTFDNAVRRAGQLAYDLNFDGPVFVFSWPTRSSVMSYIGDIDSATVSAKALKDFLRLVVAETKAAKIHLIAHSMGNLVLAEALSQLDSDTAERLVIGEMINAAPDVDPDRFAQIIGKAQAKGAKSTVYASSADRALGLSGWLRGGTRLGYISADGPPLVPGVDTIDITENGFSLFGLNHDVYAASPVIVADMRRLLQGGERPPDKRTAAFQTVTGKQGAYWRYHTSHASVEQAAKVAP